MFGIGAWEWMIILGLGLVVVGPRRLPEVARTLGKWSRELRQTTRELRLTLEEELDEEDTRRRRGEIRKRREATLREAGTTPGPVVAPPAGVENDVEVDAKVENDGGEAPEAHAPSVEAGTE